MNLIKLTKECMADHNEKSRLMWLNTTAITSKLTYSQLLILAGFREEVFKHVLVADFLNDIQEEFVSEATFMQLQALCSVASSYLKHPYCSFLSNALMNTYNKVKDGDLPCPWDTLEIVADKFKLLPAGVAECTRFSEEVLQIALIKFNEKEGLKTFGYFIGICEGVSKNFDVPINYTLFYCLNIFYPEARDRKHMLEVS